MGSYVNLKLKTDKELDFYKSLFDLYLNKENGDLPKELEEILNCIDINEELLNYAGNKLFSQDIESVRNLINIRNRILSQKRKKEPYLKIAKDNLKEFINSSEIAKIKGIISIHHIRNKFLGKENDIEFKVLLAGISTFTLGLTETITSGIENTLPSFINESVNKGEVLNNLAEHFQNKFASDNRKQTLDNSTLYKENNNRLEKIIEATEIDYLTDVFTIENEVIIQIIESENLLKFKHYTSDKVPVNYEDILIDQLQCVSSVEIPIEYVEIMATGQDNNWKDKIDTSRIIIWNKEDEEDNVKITVEPLENNGIYSSFEEMLSPYLKEPKSKEIQLNYRDKVLISIFNTLREAYPESEITNHVLKNITGYFGAELRLLLTEDEYIDSDIKGSYNKYLRQSLENLINKYNFMNGD